MDGKVKITFRLPESTLVLLEEYSATNGFSSKHDALVAILNEKLSGIYSEEAKEAILRKHSERTSRDVRDFISNDEDPKDVLERVLIESLESDRKSPDA